MGVLVLFPARARFVNPDGTLTEQASRALLEVQTRTGGLQGIVYAEDITFETAGAIAATDVQAAIEELDTEKQPLDATLTAIAGVTTAADKFIYFTGVDAAAAADLSAFARTLLDDANAGAALTTLGVNAGVQTWLASPTSTNLAAAVTGETGSGALVFGTSPTIATPTLTGLQTVEGNVNLVDSGTAALANVNLRLGRNITGGTSGLASFCDAEFQSDVTTGVVYGSQPRIATAATLTNLYHYNSAHAALSGAVQNQVAYRAANTLTGGSVSNVGFRGELANATGCYNFRATGTAANSYAGPSYFGDTIYRIQPAPTSKAAAATLTAAELLTKIIQYTGAAASLTLPTGTNIETETAADYGAAALDTNASFDFHIINTGSGTATVATAAGLTLVGTMTVTAGASGMFRVRKTAANTFTVYRIA